jgi:hypothetical protein
VAKCLYDIKYVGSIGSGNNYIEENVKTRTALGSEAYYVCQKYLKAN